MTVALSFVQYRTRNQLAALMGLYAAGGMGLAMALQYARERPNWRVARGIGLAMLVLLLAVQTQRTTDGVTQHPGSACAPRSLQVAA